ncbi:MAG: hypothetical protein GX224_02905 [Thermoplasmatales archaeon]|mgnify:CR=1 FL=1|nr:hypothetical protein [Thermoplasmatales archaeon]
MRGEFAATGIVLKYGVYVGAAIIAVGLLGLFLGTGWHEAVIAAGVAVVMATPFVGLLTATEKLLSIRDYKWALVSIAVVAITVAGAAMAWLT